MPGRHFRAECGRGGTHHCIAWAVRVSCVLTAPPRRPTRDRARTARGTGPAAHGSSPQAASRGGRRPRLRYLGAARDNAWLKHRADAVVVWYAVSRIAHDQACRARARRDRRVFGLIQLQALPWPLMIRMHSAGDAGYSWRSHLACTAPEGAAVYSFDLAKRA